MSTATVAERRPADLVIDCSHGVKAANAAAIKRGLPKVAKPSRRQAAILDECHRAFLCGAISDWGLLWPDPAVKSGPGVLSVDGAVRSDDEAAEYVASRLRALGVGRTEWGPAWLGRREVVRFPVVDVAPVSVPARPVKVRKPKRERTVVMVEKVAEPVPVAVSGDPFGDYLARLVYGPKRDYAAAWIAHVRGGGPLPADPGTPWAAKVRSKVAWYMRQGVSV